MPGSSNAISASGPTACGNAFSLKMIGIATSAAFGMPPIAVALAVTGQLVIPTMPLK